MRAFYIILLFLWLILGYFLCKNYLCIDTIGAAEKSVVAAVDSGKVYDCMSALSFIDANKNINITSNENFQFNSSSSEFLAVSDNLNATITDVIAYLAADHTRKIQIKGCYTSSEENSTGYDNLGLARADLVKEYLLGLGVNSTQISKTSRLVKDECISNGVLAQGIAVAIGVKK